jgi:hypothetical protein
MSIPLDSEALTTVSAVRDGFSTSASDDAITRMINRVSQRFAQRCARTWAWAISDSSAPEYIRCQGKFWLYVKRKPITDVVQIRVGLHSYPNGFVGYTLHDYQRTAQWDKQGKIYRLAGWVMLAPEFDRLTGKPDTRRASQLFSAEVQYSGGYILPQYDGIISATHNPAGASRNLPWQLEDACIREVRNLLVRPHGSLIEERTAGGWSQKFSDHHSGRGTEFDESTEAILDAETRPSGFMS